MIVTSENYPHPSILDEFPFGIQDDVVSKLTEKWRPAMVSFHVNKPHSDKDLLMVGSGFLLDMFGTPFIATASHVLMQVREANLRIIIVGGQKYRFEKVEAYHNEEQDYAMINPPEEMLKSNRPFSFFKLAPRPELSATSSFIIMGYPSSRNKFHKDKEWKGLSCFSVAFHSFKYDTDNEDLIFHYHSKNAKKGLGITFEPSSSFNSVPELEGMSGGCIVQIMINSETDELTLKPVGIFKEHKKKLNYLVGCTFIPFADELNQTLF
jgi:hypothetical protein